MIHYDDLIITIAYFSITVQMVVALHQFPHVLQWRLRLLSILFALFIFMCGTGHLLRCLGLTHDNSLAFTIVNSLTAAVSVLTAVYLFPIRSTILQFLDHKELESQAASRKQILTFMNFLCHEVRNPLFAITSTITFLGDDEQLTHEQEGALECIQQSANLMLRLVNDVLDISKLESGQLHLEPHLFDLRQLLQGTAVCLQTQMDQKRLGIVTFHYELAPTVPGLVIGDSVRLLQIVYNLLSNAAKFTEQGFVRYSVDVVSVATALEQGWITTTTPKATTTTPMTQASSRMTMLVAEEDGSEPSSSYDNHSKNDNDSSLKLLEEGAKDHCNASSYPSTTVVLQVQVQDTGPGIEAEQLEGIFEPYSQSLHYRHHGGTGLGLSILDRLTQIMGGSIRVQSQVGQGSTFTVYIPVQVPSTNNRRTVAEQDASSNSMPQVLSTAMAAMEQDSTMLLENPTMTLRTPSRRKVMPGTYPLSSSAIEDAPPSTKDIIVVKTTITAPSESETKANGPILTAKIETGDPPPPSLPIAPPPEPPTTPPKSRLSFSPPALRTTKTPSSSPPPSPMKGYLRKSSSGMLKEKFDFDPNENIVLVVDDNAMNRKLFGRMLSQFHIQHEYAVHGAEAVEYMRKSRNYNPQNQNAPNVGLILMDWSMPVMDGCQAIQAIRNDLGLKHVPIVAVTACALEARKEALLEAGANEFATKPLLRDDLYEKCQRYLLWPPTHKKVTSVEGSSGMAKAKRRKSMFG